MKINNKIFEFNITGSNVEIMKFEQESSTSKAWMAFRKKYRAQTIAPDNSRILDLLATLSHQSNFSLGCHCDDEAHCHRSVLRELLLEKDAMPSNA